MAEELPLFLGLNDKTVTDIPKTVEKQRYMTSVAPKAANPGKWVEQPRMPIPTGEHAVIECQGKIHSIAGYAKHRVDQNFHQVYDPASQNLVAEGALPACPAITSPAFRSARKSTPSAASSSRTAARIPNASSTTPRPTSGRRSRRFRAPRGAISAIVLDGKIHLLGGRDVRSVEWHEIYDPATDKYSDPRRHARLDRHAAFRRPARPHGRRRGRRKNPRHRRPHG